MKTMSLMLVLLLVFLLVPGDIAMSNDRPYKPNGYGGVDDGDDHPWGGENRSDGGVITLRPLPPRVSLGVVILDCIFRVPLAYEYEEAAARRIEHKLYNRLPRIKNRQTEPVNVLGESPNRSERVSK